MTKGPKISVIMPAYNAASYIREAITSVIAQTYGNFELMVIDDGSTDSTQLIIQEFDDPRIKYVRNEENIGLIRTLNKAFVLAENEFIARIDSDDICMPDRFELQLAEFKREPSLGVVGSTAIIIDKFGTYQGLFKAPEFHSDIAMGMIFTNQVIHPSVMLRKSVVANRDSNVFSKNDIHVEDYGLWVDLLSTTKFYNVQKPLIKYRMHGENISKVYAGVQLTNGKILKQKVCDMFGIKPNLEVIEMVGDKRLAQPETFFDINKEVFEKLNEEFRESKFISRLFWESQIILKIGSHSVFRDYIHSNYKKKFVWVALLLLTPLIKRLPQKMFEKRLRIFKN